MKFNGTFYVVGTPNYHSILPERRYDSAAAARKAASEGRWLDDPNIADHVAQDRDHITLNIRKVTINTDDFEALTAVVAGRIWPTKKVKISTKEAGLVDVTHLATAARNQRAVSQAA